MVHDWLVDEDYGSDHDRLWNETFYFDSLKERGQEVWIWWRCQREYLGNQYWRRQIDIDFHVRYLREIEVMHKGKKIKTNWGEIEIWIYSRLKTDVGDKWKKHWLLKHLNEFFWKRMNYKQFELHKFEVYRDAYNLQHAIKRFLKLQSRQPPEKTFWPELGVGNE